MEILLTLLGIAVGFTAGYAINHFRHKATNDHQIELALTKQKLESATEEVLKAEKKVADAENINRQQQQEISTLREQKAIENATLQNTEKRLQEQKQEMEEMQKTAHLQFEKIATQILEEKTGKFTETNKISIEALLKPLGESLEGFKQRIELTFTEETKQRSSLEAQVKELVEQTNKVSSEANNLASALKGQAKTMGNWGELILESILQQSGLVKGREYVTQSSYKDDGKGKLKQPDVLINLPDNRTIIIDSKVSLVAYDKYFAAETKESQELFITEHIKSLKAHIDNLASKEYDNLESALDFTMLFVPIEPAYILAIQHDNELWNYAYNKRILLISPTNLIACLKLIADLWKRELQSKNAVEIVKRGNLIYEKLVGFFATFENMGRSLEKATESYEQAKGQLNNGAGNLITQTQQLKKLGLKSNKEITGTLLSNSEEEEI